MKIITHLYPEFFADTWTNKPIQFYFGENYHKYDFTSDVKIIPSPDVMLNEYFVDPNNPKQLENISVYRSIIFDLNRFVKINNNNKYRLIIIYVDSKFLSLLNSLIDSNTICVVESKFIKLL